MNAKPLAEMALQLWNRIGDRPLREKGAIIQTLTIWVQTEQLEMQQAPSPATITNAAVPALPEDEHYRA